MSWRTALALALALGSCTVPYQPLQARADNLPADAFDRVLMVVRPQYPDLLVVDREGFRLQSAWVPHDVADRAGQRRATVFLDAADLISVVVETRYLGLDLLGNPSWSRSRGDPRLERALLEAILGVLRTP